MGLLKRGHSFGAWKDSAISYKQTDDNIKISVDTKDIQKSTNEADSYQVLNAESVEIIG
jgi:hypothetical protein